MRFDYDLTNASKVEKYTATFLDVSYTPCAAKNGAWGISTLYYPASLVHEVTYLDEDGEPMKSTDGYAILEYEEDSSGNRVWEGYYDEYHTAANCAEGYSSKESTYDSSGRLTGERYLDRFNKLTNNKDGIAGWNGYYDADGNLVITSMYDKDRSAISAEDVKGRAEQ